MKSYSTTWKIPKWAWLPIGLAITAEAVSNALRAYGLGMHLEKFTIEYQGYSVSIAGSVLVLAAVAVSLSQAKAAWVALVPTNPARVRIVAGLAAILLLAVSITAMASHLLESQRAKVADEGGERAKYDRAEAAYKAAQAEFEALGGIRTPEAIKAAMGAAPVSRAVFRRTAECTDVTRDDSFEACKPILDLRQEMGLAIRKHELEKALPGLKAELDNQRRPEVASETESKVSGVWSWIMGLAVVFIATFGSVIFARVETVTTDDPTAKSGPEDRPEGGRTVEPKRPTPPRRPSVPELPDAENERRKADVLQFIRTENKVSGPIQSQYRLSEQTGVPDATLSDWISRWEAEGLVECRKEGRRKVIAVPDGRRKAVAAG